MCKDLGLMCSALKWCIIVVSNGHRNTGRSQVVRSDLININARGCWYTDFHGKNLYREGCSGLYTPAPRGRFTALTCLIRA